MQVLIVEDDPDIRRMYEQQIRSYGHEVTACEDAQSALEAYQQNFYPLIIVDLGLPGMDGLEFCRRIRSLPQGDQSMMLVIAGHDKLEDLQAALDAGADDYLTKPVNVEMLQVRLTIIERQFRDRTHHQQAEEKIRQQHEFLEHILESLTYPFYVVDPNTYTITMANSTARQNGISPASACHVLLHHTPTPCSGTTHPCPLQQVKTTRNPAIVEHLHHDQNENPKYAEIHAYPIFDDDGNVTQIIEYTLDITERKHVEEQLRLSEERYTLAQKVANIGSWDWNIQTGYLHWSDQIESLFGFARGEFKATYEAFLECVYSDDRRHVIDSVNATLEENKDYAIEHRIVWPDGTVRWVSETGDVIRSEDGKAIRMLGIVQDITERKRVEEELQTYRDHLEELVEERTAKLQQTNKQLRQEIAERKRAEQAVQTSEQQYRALAEHVANGISIVRGGKPVFINEVFCSMLAYTKEELLQIDHLDIFRDDYKELFMKRFEQLLQGTSVPEMQAVCVTKDGREIWVEERSTMIEWEGKPAIMATMRDITEHKLRDLEIEEEREHLQRENINLRTSVKDRYKFGEIIGKSPAMQEIYELIAHTAATESYVMITGESGTGKELVAHMIHQLSDRQDQPFVPVNCGAIPENLLESEFFGHRRGAFTGADRDKAGYFDQAHQGTLFLDEVGELSPLLQVKLLRALERGEYTPIGSTMPKTANVRIISATNRDPHEQVRTGTMRKDFFFRLSTIAIDLPPLRERKEDLLLLIDHFLDQHQDDRGMRPILPAKVYQILLNHDWPGNIRELQHALERYVTVKRLDLPGSKDLATVNHDNCPVFETAVESQNLQEAVEAFEKQFLRKMLEQHRWHKSETAQALGIGRKTLYRKMKQFDLL